MARVWGATAPARLVVLLLLMALRTCEICAAPLRAQGAGEWAETRPKLGGTGGLKSGCIAMALHHPSLGPPSVVDVRQRVMGSTAGAGQEPVAALLPRPGSSRAGPWLCCLLAGAQPSSWEGGVLGRAHKMCAGRRVSVFCPRRVVLPVGDSQFPTQSPGPQPRGGDTCASLQCFSAAFLCVYQRPPSKKAPRGCILFRAVREGCGTWPGESIVYPARCQPTGHRGHSATLEIVTRVLLPSRPMTHVQLLWGKEMTPCSGNFSHLFLIVDDELGALFLDDRLDPDFMPVPEGQPRGQSCLFP